jgi:hypothetical protein
MELLSGERKGTRLAGIGTDHHMHGPCDVSSTVQSLPDLRLDAHTLAAEASQAPGVTNTNLFRPVETTGYILIRRSRPGYG